jgi:hypothetical protein
MGLRVRAPCPPHSGKNPKQAEKPVEKGFSAFFVGFYNARSPPARRDRRGHKETQEDNFIYCGMHCIGHRHTFGVFGGTGSWLAVRPAALEDWKLIVAAAGPEAAGVVPRNFRSSTASQLLLSVASTVLVHDFLGHSAVAVLEKHMPTSRTVCG